MMKNIFKKGLVFGIIVLFIGTIIFPTISGNYCIQRIEESKPRTLDTGPVAYWNFNEGTGDVLHDVSGNGNDGTIYGAQWNTGISGGGLHFDGVDDYVNCGNGPTLNIANEISICAWIKFDALNYWANVIVGKWCSPSSHSYVLFIYNPDYGKPRFSVSWDHDLSSNTLIEPGTWYFLTGTYNQQTGDYKIYLNGTEIISSSFAGGISQSNEPLYIGSDTESEPKYFDGIIDEVRIYNRELSQQEIQYLYNNPGIVNITYVDDDYNSSTPGWGYDHFNKIQDGIDAVAESGTVYVYSGIYTESFTNYCYVYIYKNISLIGENKDTTIINCPDPGTFDYSGVQIGWLSFSIVANVTISGFTVIGAHHIRSIGIYLGPFGRNITVENCAVHSFARGVELWDVNDCLVKNCKTYDNFGTTGVWHGGGIYLASVENSVIVDCDSYSNSQGIYLDITNSNIIVYHNNLYNNSENAHDEGGINSWYSITLHEGNYYNDYTGLDNDHNGIGDTPYPIPGGNNKDYYPLMTPYGPPHAEFTYTKNDKYVLFNASYSYDYNGEITSYEWDFGDGQTGTGMTTSHTYSNYGTYDVTLTITDNDGITDSTSKEVNISDEIPPTISNVKATPPVQVPGGYVNISATVTDNVGLSDVGLVLKYPDQHIEYISIIDNKTGNTYYYNITYDMIGVYNFFIWAVDTSNNYQNSFLENFEITEKLACDAGGPYYGNVSENIQFEGYAINGVPPYSWHWEFGDGNYSNEQNPKHKYDTKGIYNVTLTVTDSIENQANDTTIANITTKCLKPLPPIINGPTRGKPNVVYDYKFSLATDPNGDNCYLYVDWGDGISTGWLGPYLSGGWTTINHSWSKQGTYSIKAKTKNICGAESDWGTLQVTMPRNRISYNTLLQRILQNHPNLFPILQRLLNSL